jgi:hypothetical protein
MCKHLILSHYLGFSAIILCALGLESCANSYQILAEREPEAKNFGRVGSGTVYVSVDVSGAARINRTEAASMNASLGSSIARALDSSFRQSRSVPDLSRLEPDSADVVVFVRAMDPTYPEVWGDISKGWLRLIVAGVLAGIYETFTTDIPTYRNSVVLPVAALALPLYSFFYCYQYESTKGSLTLPYQVSVLKPDGTLLNRRQFTDSAKVLVQADTKIENLPIEDIMNATVTGISSTVRRFVNGDSTRIRNLGEEMNRTYRADCDRILTFKRNIDRVLDDSTSTIR